MFVFRGSIAIYGKGYLLRKKSETYLFLMMLLEEQKEIGRM